jgi:hypothetical protein
LNVFPQRHGLATEKDTLLKEFYGIELLPFGYFLSLMFNYLIQYIHVLC